MKRIIALIFAVLVCLLSGFSALAAGTVTYSGNSGEFVFAPGSDYSPTDLFTEFKSVMPGDRLTQEITVKNKADNKVKVNIYMRALGAHADSVDFLSKLNLTVAKSDDNRMGYMFDATADETAGLTDWVLLGTLYSGGEVELEIGLNVPVELDNKYSNQVGYLDWEFKVEEFPIEETDPKPPQTGDEFDVTVWIIIAVAAVIITIVLFIILGKKNKKD
jgi:hypothetical protein